MGATTMATAKAAIVARIKAADLPDVSVLFGGKVQKDGGFSAGRIISLGDITFTRLPATLQDVGGQPSVDEQYDIAGVIEVTVTGTRQDRATISACELFDQLDDLLRVRDETLQVAGVLYARVVGEGRVIEAKDQRTLSMGRSCSIPFNIHVWGVI